MAFLAVLPELAWGLGSLVATGTVLGSLFAITGEAVHETVAAIKNAANKPDDERKQNMAEDIEKEKDKIDFTANDGANSQRKIFVNQLRSAIKDKIMNDRKNMTLI